MRSGALTPLPGGMSLSTHKVRSTAHEVVTAPIPAQLRFPLVSNNGHDLSPQVSAGDVITGGKLLACGGDQGVPVVAPTSGRIVGIEDHPLAHPAGIDGPCIVLETDGEDRQQRLSPLSADASSEQIVQRARDAGIAGLGGAAFPTWRKLGSAQPGGTETLIINGAECEPYISCDDMLMRERANDVIDGAKLMRRALAATEVLIAIEDDKPQAIAAIRAVMEVSKPSGMRLAVLPTRYPEGGERQLIQVLTGAEVPSSGLPADIGMHCQNVGTAAALADAVLRGQSLRTRVVTMTGDAVRDPGNLIAVIGTPIAFLIEAAGGYRVTPERLIMGGPLMGFTLASDEAAITPSTNCVIAAAPGEFSEPEMERACIRCGDCADVCPAGLLPQQLHWAIRSRAMDDAERLHVPACIECGCCDVVCPSQIPLTQQFRFAKQEITLRKIERARSDSARERFGNRAARLERLAGERATRLAAKRAARGIGTADKE
jgi:H+/Na+-translocating ferredoxin:NAD+ oxidoreductase subunit C